MIETIKENIINIIKANKEKGRPTFASSFQNLGNQSRFLMPDAMRQLKDEGRIEARQVGMTWKYYLLED